MAYTRIPCLIVFPDDYTNEKTVEFSFPDKKEFVTSFSLQVKAHIPVFKPETSLFAGNTMEGFQSTVYIPPVQFGPDGGNSGNSSSGSGGSALYGNLFGQTGSSGQFGASSGFGPEKDPTWPINPSTNLPPHDDPSDN